MDVTIINPGVIAPSQMPRKARHAKNSPNVLAAAWQRSATAQTKMLKLNSRPRSACALRTVRYAGGKHPPHPFSYGEILECEVLRPLEHEEEEVEDGA